MSMNCMNRDLRDGDYLEHHGVLGHKLGVRRFQDYTGRLIKSGSNAIKRAKYGKAYDADITGSVKTSAGKTKYTNLDGTLNEKGKVLASTFVQNEIKKNDKYYDKQIKKYNKAAEAYSDDANLSKAFKRMAKSAEESKNATDENLKKLSVDLIVQIQNERNETKLKVAAGAAINSAVASGSQTVATAETTVRRRQ